MTQNPALSIGILAYGSLIEHPDTEIKNATAKIISEEIVTPFEVEFARKSSTRKGAPTLVPVENGKGAKLSAQIFILHPAISESQARDILWRRETGNVGTQKTYKRTDNPNQNTMIVAEISDFHGLANVFYTKIGANIDELNAEHLADLAIKSAKAKDNAGQDGITYLMNALKRGVKTPLSGDYEAQVLNKTGSKTLKEALEKCRNGARQSD